MYVQPYFPQLQPIMRQTKQEDKKGQQPFVLRPFHYEILKLVHEYHFLTVWQLVKLRYSDGSLTWVRVELFKLADNGYLDRRELPHVGRGQSTFIYALATKGINELKDLGMSGFSRFRPQEFQQFKYPHLEHVLHLNDFLIAARNLSKVAPDITLASMRHDLDLKHEPAKVAYARRLPDGDKVDETVKLVPDGWLDFHLQLSNTPKKRRKCVVVELDRGSETNASEFKKKIRAYVHYAYPGGAYEKMFGTQAITVAFATTGGENRLKTMLLWCEQELQDQRLQHEAPLFRFTALPKEELNPETGLNAKRLFLSEVWSIPFAAAPVCLLWKP